MNDSTTAGWSYDATGTATVRCAEYEGHIEVSGDSKDGIHPRLYFKFVKRKMGILEKAVTERRLKKLEKVFDEAVENGQIMLGEKIMKEIAREMRETRLYAKGIRHYIHKKDLFKHKNNIRGGHISDTRLSKYTRIVPKNVLRAKKKYEKLFDDFVVLHYYNEKAEKKREEKQEMSPEEKDAMRDPILFGTVGESDRWYYVADWEDDYCDLTFDEIIDVLGETKIEKDPKLEIKRRVGRPRKK